MFRWLTMMNFYLRKNEERLSGAFRFSVVSRRKYGTIGLASVDNKGGIGTRVRPSYVLEAVGE